MPASNVLHIQGRSEGPPTVVALQGTSVRIGRGRRCEVQLTGARLAEIQCILRLGRDGWHLQPVGPPGLISIYGEPIYASRRLDFNVPVRVGEHWLTLRDLETQAKLPAPVAPVVIDCDPVVSAPAEARFARNPLPDLMAPLEPAPVPEPVVAEPIAAVAAEPAPAPAAESEEAKRLRAWESSLREREERLRQLETTKAWESKWRAAGERLRRQNTTPIADRRPVDSPSAKLSRTRVDAPAASPASRPLLDPLRTEYRPPRLIETPHSHIRPMPVAAPVARTIPPAAPLQRPIRPESREVRPPAETRPASESTDEAHGASEILTDPITWTESATFTVESPAPALPRMLVEPSEFVVAPPAARSLEVIRFEPDSVPEPEAEAEPEIPVIAPPLRAFRATPDGWELVTDGPVVDLGPCAVPELSIDSPFALSEPVLTEVVTDPEEAAADFAPAPGRPVESVLHEQPVFPLFEADWGPGDQLGPTIVDIAALVTSTGPALHDSHTSVARIAPWDVPVEPLGVLLDPEDEDDDEIAPPPPVIEPVRSFRSDPAHNFIPEPITPREPIGFVPSPMMMPLAPTARIEPAAPFGEREVETRGLPTAGAIIAAQQKREVPEPLKPRRVSRGPTPTERRLPEQWNAPFWVAVLPALVGLVGLGGGSMMLSTYWAVDDQIAAVAMNSALRSETDTARLDPEIRPVSAWYRTTATHLAAWALAIERSGEGAAGQEEAAQLLEAARHIAPLHPTVRYALAQAPNAEPATLLGLPRDAAALALGARKLKEMGKPKESLALIRQAFAIAGTAEPSSKADYAFDGDANVRRYRLPRESEIRNVARWLVDQTDWPHAEWSQALPDSAVTRLAVARMLREKGSSDAVAAFDQVIAVNEPPAHHVSEHWAARAEALAFRERGEEAVETYRKAIDAAPDARTSRLYAYNLAEILRPMSRDDDRAKLLQAATSDDPGEEVTRRALDAQALAGMTAARPAVAPSPEPPPTADPNIVPAGHETESATSTPRGAP